MATTEELIAKARQELLNWETIRNERGRVAREARERHEMAVEQHAKWVHHVRELESREGAPDGQQ